MVRLTFTAIDFIKKWGLSRNDDDVMRPSRFRDKVTQKKRGDNDDRQQRILNAYFYSGMSDQDAKVRNVEMRAVIVFLPC